jgi:putative peptidoglycan lipid II flippase
MAGLSLGRAFRQIGSLTALSRILGFVRDIAFATFLGAGAAADAFLVALKLPNMFRRLSAEGAMTNAFLPNYASIRETYGQAAATKLAAEAQIFLILGLSMIVIIAEIFMADLILLLAPGFANTPDRLIAATDLARITMPYLLLISVVALWASIANAHDHFKAGATVPIIANICFIAGAVMIPFIASHLNTLRAIPIAIALVVAGFAQLIFLYWALSRFNAVPALILPRLSDAGRKMWQNFLPAAAGAGGMQLNLLIDLILASLLPVGAISWLYYADRVAQLPLGVVGIALGTALLPKLSKAEAAGQFAQVRTSLSEAIGFAGFFVIPAVTGLVLCGLPIIKGLFVYGAFTVSDAEMAAMALAAYGCGLPGFVLVKILQAAFYATGQPIVVLKISLITVAINVVGSLSLMPILGHVGLALATAVSGTMAATIMLYLMARQHRLCASFLPICGRIILASAVMGAVIVILQFGVDKFFTAPAAIGLAIIVGGGSAVYAATAHILGAVPAGLMRQNNNRNT